jgi:hypothetical protein
MLKRLLAFFKPKPKPDPVLTCRYCAGTKFLEGPSGGLCTNVQCDACGARYNVYNATIVEILRDPTKETAT